MYFYILLMSLLTYLINDTLRFLFDAYVFFVNTPVPTHLRFRQALVFTDNMHLITKASCMSYYKVYCHRHKQNIKDKH